MPNKLITGTGVGNGSKNVPLPTKMSKFEGVGESAWHSMACGATREWEPGAGGRAMLGNGSVRGACRERSAERSEGMTASV